MTKKIATLTAGIIATKGAAAPSVEVSPTAKAVDAGGKKVAITVRLEPGLYRKVKLFGVDTGTTNQDIFVAAVEEYLSRHA